MTTNYDDAYGLITTELQAYWATISTSIVGMVPEIRFYGTENDKIPSTYFVRFVMSPVKDGQSSFRQTDGKRFRADGLIYLQVFAPRSDRASYAKMRKLSMQLQKRFRSAIDCISFNNVRIVDAPKEDMFWRQNVIAEYWYDEIQA